MVLGGKTCIRKDDVVKSPFRANFPQTNPIANQQHYLQQLAADTFPDLFLLNKSSGPTLDLDSARAEMILGEKHQRARRGSCFLCL